MVSIDKITFLLDGPTSPPIDWNDDILGMSSYRFSLRVDVSGDPLPKFIDVEMRVQPPNKTIASSSGRVSTWTIPRDGTTKSYFLSGYLGDLNYLFKPAATGLRLATIHRLGGVSDTAFRQSGSWIHRGTAFQPGDKIGGDWRRTGDPLQGRPDAKTLLFTAGVEVLEAKVPPQQGWIMRAKPARQLVRSTANVLYYTGHAGGDRDITDSGSLKIEQGGPRELKYYEQWVILPELQSYWLPNVGLDVFVIAGCFSLSGSFASWGAASGTSVMLSRLLRKQGGPLTAILGYGSTEYGDDGHSPLDANGGNEVARLMAEKIKSGSTNYVDDWLAVNMSVAGRSFGRNACGIDARGHHHISHQTGAIQPPSNLVVDKAGNPIRP